MIEAKFSPEEERVKRLVEELRKEYPGLRLNEESLEILKLVGTLPYIPVEEEKSELIKAISERYEFIEKYGL